MVNKIIEKITDPYSLISSLGVRGLFNWMSDEKYLKMLWRLKFHKSLNLDNPQTFNEKLQWLKIHDRKPIYTTMADKYAVKKYVADKIGGKYIIPTLGVWESFEDINFDILPNQFVLKCTHDSGGIIIVKDKNNFDKKSARKLLERNLIRNFYYCGREWPYKNVPPRIIAEKYMEDSQDKELRDYKFYCFDGKVHALLLVTNRHGKGKMYFDYFDSEFSHLYLTNHWHSNAPVTPRKPYSFDTMIELAKILSTGIPHVRVDFYEMNGRVYFGEMTFYVNSGFLKIHPDDWEIEWGNLIRLPQ